MNAIQQTFQRLALLAVAAGAGAAGAFETVVIDPGHGGNDEGTKWRHVPEKDLTMSVAQRLEKILRAKHIHTVLTRHGDAYVSLDDRAEIANLYPESLLLSIHFNGSSASDVNGLEIYTFRGSPTSRMIAESIHGALLENLHARDRGVRANQDYAVLVRTFGSAVLVECGYISNKAESARLVTPEGQQALAEALALGVMRIKPLMNTDPPEADLVRCEIQQRRHEKTFPKTEVVAEKKPEKPKKVAASSGKRGKGKKKSKTTAGQSQVHPLHPPKVRAQEALGQ